MTAEGTAGGGQGTVATRRGRRERGALGAALIVVLALVGTLLLYREAPGLPFFFDDMIHLRWLDWHSLPSIWTTAEGLGYYRPLTMSAWKIGHMWQGIYDPQTFHLLNLVVHALNTVLVAQLAWRAYRGTGRYVFALVSAALFLTYPFSYQAVPSTSSLSKPLIATLVLGSAVLYWEARRRQSGWLMAFSLVAGFLAPFAYETGVTVPLAILSVEVLGTYRQEFRRFSRWPVVYMLLLWGVALPLVVLMEPETGASLRFPSLLNLWQNGVYFSQGLMFPIAALATPLGRLLPVDEYVMIAAVNLLGFAALFAFYRWARQLVILWYSLSWFVVAVLPLWLMLDFSYVITSPRLLYLGGVGSALLWAAIPVLLWARLPSRWSARVLAVGAVLAMLAFNVAYVRQKMVLADAVAAPLWEAADAARAEGPTASLLYLNVPAWVAPKQPTYRLGTEGLTFIPEYVRVQDSIYVNAGVEPEIRAFMFDPVKQDWKAYIGYAGGELDLDGLAEEIRQAEGVYLTAYSAGGLRFVEAGGLEMNANRAADEAALARFGEDLLLSASQAELRESELVLKLWWVAPRIPGENATVFVHVYDEEGQLVAQRDGYPLSGLFPPWQWQAGDLVRDVRLVALPGNLDSGRYTVAVGWYNPDSGQRLPSFDQQGQRVEQDAVRVFEFVIP